MFVFELEPDQMLYFSINSYIRLAERFSLVEAAYSKGKDIKEMIKCIN